MKRIISALLAAAFVLGPALLPASASSGEREAEIIYSDIKITLDGQAVNPLDADGNPAEPFILDGSVYLPVRAVADALGLGVRWRGEDSTVLLETGEDKYGLYNVGAVDLPMENRLITQVVPGRRAGESVTLTYRDIRLLLDGVVLKPLDASGNPAEPFILDGTVYLPVRAAAEALGLSVDWDAESGTVKLRRWLVSRHAQKDENLIGIPSGDFDDSYEYDSLGRATGRVSVYGGTRSESRIAYDSLGRVASGTQRIYDGDRKIYENSMTAVYDGDSGRCLAYDWQKGYSERWEYDGQGRLVRAENLGRGKIQNWAQWSYDEHGRISELRGLFDIPVFGPIFQPEEKIRRYSYDEQGRLTHMEEEPLIQVKLVYDEDGRETGYVYCDYYNMLFFQIQRLYDENGLLLREESFSGLNWDFTGVTEYSYDELGRLIREERTDVRDGQASDAGTTVYSYDENGCLIRREVSKDSGSLIETWEYTQVPA